MTTLTDMVPAIAVNAEAVTTPVSMTAEQERELNGLAGYLLSSMSGVRPFCLLMIELGGAKSSLWLTTNLATVLGERLNGTVHVLSMQDRESTRRSPLTSVRSADAESYVFESIAAPANGRVGAGALAARLGSLREACEPVLIHLPNDQDLASILPHAAAIDGVVLLVRASHTRRTSLQNIGRQLTRAGIRGVGCVLLDRVHPIPEKLYKLL